MNPSKQVPRIDLAPKLKRPLSLWNPLDYLRLLYWILYFPQALRWYTNTFGGGYISPKGMTWQKGWQLLRQNVIQRQLLIQGLVLTVFTALCLSKLLEQTYLLNLDRFATKFSIVLIILLGIAVGLFFALSSNLALGIATELIFTLAFILNVISTTSLSRENQTADIIPLVVLISALGIWISIVFAMSLNIDINAIVGVSAMFGAFSIIAGSIFIFLALLGVLVALASGVSINAAISAFLSFLWILISLLGIPLTLAFAIGILRLENWIIGLISLLDSRSLQLGSWLYPRTTPISLPFLSSRLTNWLRQDWEVGVDNINQILQYSSQFTSVTRAINQSLAETPPDLVLFRLTYLTASPVNWRLIYFSSASLGTNLKSDAMEGLLFLSVLFRRIQDNIASEPRLDTFERAGAAGFWYFHKKDVHSALKAFTVVRSLPYGEELFILAQTLSNFTPVTKVDTIANLQIPNFPQGNLLRPNTWKALKSLCRVVENARLLQNSFSRNTKAFALSRAIGELTEIIANESTLPEAEKGLIIDIAHNWKQALESIAKDIGQVSITKPVINPYIIGDPVFGNLFIGREDILRQLEELWVTGNSLQSVVLYGHRRMGKTSILRNLPTQFGADVKVIYINLQSLGDITQGIGEVLMAICDEISDRLAISPPQDEELLKLPERTFKLFLKTVLQQSDTVGLIVALDEFETIEELINAKKIPNSFIGYLRGLIQMSPKIAFAFAGLHTLEEMTADYFNPFFGSVISIRVSFLQPAATRQILANPSEDFLLDYTPEALDKIFNLTAGQPYLVQLIGFQLVRQYNDCVFERGSPRNATLTVEDVEATIDNPKFFQQGRYYFEGVWGQASEGASGQQQILQALAIAPEGLTTEALIATTGMDETASELALETLKRHDVIQITDSGWRIIVELFRSWVLEHR